MIHRFPCNGVVHLRVYFSLTDMTLEELTEVALFTGMLGRLPTRKYDALRLQQEIKRCTGSLGFSVSCRSNAGESDTCTPYLVAFASALEENEEKAQELLAEIDQIKEQSAAREQELVDELPCSMVRRFIRAMFFTYCENGVTSGG